MIQNMYLIFLIKIEVNKLKLIYCSFIQFKIRINGIPLPASGSGVAAG